MEDLKMYLLCASMYQINGGTGEGWVKKVIYGQPPTLVLWSNKASLSWVL